MRSWVQKECSIFPDSKFYSKWISTFGATNLWWPHLICFPFYGFTFFKSKRKRDSDFLNLWANRSIKNVYSLSIISIIKTWIKQHPERLSRMQYQRCHNVDFVTTDLYWHRLPWVIYKGKKKSTTKSPYAICIALLRIKLVSNAWSCSQWIHLSRQRHPASQVEHETMWPWDKLWDVISHMHICSCMCIHMYTHKYMYVYVCVYTNTHTHTHTRINK